MQWLSCWTGNPETWIRFLAAPDRVFVRLLIIITHSEHSFLWYIVLYVYFCDTRKLNRKSVMFKALQNFFKQYGYVDKMSSFLCNGNVLSREVTQMIYFKKLNQSCISFFLFLSVTLLSCFLRFLLQLRQAAPCLYHKHSNTILLT